MRIRIPNKDIARLKTSVGTAMNIAGGSVVNQKGHDWRMETMGGKGSVPVVDIHAMAHVIATSPGWDAYLAIGIGLFVSGAKSLMK